MSRTFEQLTAEQRDTIQQLNEQHFTQTGIDSLYIITDVAFPKKCGTWNYYFPDGSLMKKEEY